MKKIVSLLLALMLITFGAFALAETAATETPELAEPEFDPNPEYTEYTVVEYTIEEIQADLVCTISRKALEDGTTDYYLECNFYGDDQMTHTIYKGGDKALEEIDLEKDFDILEDKTGFMKGDTPKILKIAMEQDVWLPIEAEAK